MKRFEYDFHYINPKKTNVLQFLTERGALGWEFIQFFNDYLWFKRELPEDTERKNEF